MRRMALHLIIASAEAVVRSSSLLLRRERPFQALVRSTTQRRRTALKPFVPGGGDWTSTDQSGRFFASQPSHERLWYLLSPKITFSRGKSAADTGDNSLGAAVPSSAFAAVTTTLISNENSSAIPAYPPANDAGGPSVSSLHRRLVPLHPPRSS